MRLPVLLCLPLLLIAGSTNAQLGADDGGLLSIGGHTALPPHTRHGYTIGLMQSYGKTSERTEIEYLTTELAASRAFEFGRIGLALMWAHSESVLWYGAGPEFAGTIVQGAGAQIERSPADESFTKQVGNSAFGDLRVRYSADFGAGSAFSSHAELSYPIEALDPTRSLLMQSAIGVPSLSVALGYDSFNWHIPPGDARLSNDHIGRLKLRYGATLGYRVFVGTNSFGLIPKSDLALTFRGQTMGSDLRFGGDLSGVFHAADDGADSNSSFEYGYRRRGLTLNAGATLTYINASAGGLLPQYSIALFLASPIYTEQRAGFYGRSYTLGLVATYSVP